MRNSTESVFKLSILAVATTFSLWACQSQGTRFSIPGGDDTQSSDAPEEATSAPATVSETVDLADINSPLTALLGRYIRSEGNIDYERWKKNPNDTSELKSVLANMSKVDLSQLSEQDKKAFLINAYNTMTLDLVLSHYAETEGTAESPLPNHKSIRNIGNLGDQVWDQDTWEIAGQSYSLNQVEHQLLRPLGDARIHIAINCASRGCPPLQPEAYQGETIDEKLNLITSQFVNSERDTVINESTQTITTSQIINWFTDDFVQSFGSVLAFFSEYKGEDLSQYTVEYSEYDWSLNEPAPPSSSPADFPRAPSGSRTERELL